MGGTAMMSLYIALKYLHILGAAVLFGTGLGIAFFMFMANRSHDIALIAGTARIVVVADFLFTATAVVAQPLTGIGLVQIAGYDFRDSWVVLMQIEIRNLAANALEAGNPLPERYHRLMKMWFWSGWPAFLAVLAIIYLMLAKPTYW